MRSGSVLNGDTVELRFVPRATLATVKVKVSTDLKNWSEAAGVTFTGNTPGQETVVTAPKPAGTSAFFKLVFEYAE